MFTVIIGNNHIICAHVIIVNMAIFPAAAINVASSVDLSVAASVPPVTIATCALAVLPDAPPATAPSFYTVGASSPAAAYLVGSVGDSLSAPASLAHSVAAPFSASTPPVPYLSASFLAEASPFPSVVAHFLASTPPVP